MPTRGRRLLGPIGVRLALAMVAVALGAVAVFAGLILVSAADEVRGLATEVQTAATQTVAETVADAYRARGGWVGVDLTAATAFANEADATLTVLNKRGSPIGPPRVDQNVSNPTGALRSAAVTVSGESVGRAVLHFATSGLSGPEHQLRVALWENVAVGSGVAAVLALILSVLVSRRITQPVVELTAAVQAMESGDRTARVERPHAPGELEDLGLAFNRFADALARDEGVRRAVVSDVAHELRTPLAILQASTEALIDHVERPTNAILASLHDEVLRIGRIVQDLETLSSAQAAQLQMKSGPQDLASICRNALAAMGPFFASAGIAVVQDLRPVEAHVDADRISASCRESAQQRHQVHPTGGYGHDPYLHRARRRGLDRLRHRARHPSRGDRPHLRTILARCERWKSRRERHRAGRCRRTCASPWRKRVGSERAGSRDSFRSPRLARSEPIWRNRAPRHPTDIGLRAFNPGGIRTLAHHSVDQRDPGTTWSVLSGAVFDKRTSALRTQSRSHEVIGLPHRC